MGEGEGREGRREGGKRERERRERGEKRGRIDGGKMEEGREGGETDGGDDIVTYNSVGVLATNGHELTSSCMGRPSTVQRIDQDNMARQYSAKGSTKWLQSAT